MRRGFLLLAFVAAVATASGVEARPAQTVPRYAVAIVDGELILRRSFDEELLRVRRSYQLKDRALPATGTAARKRIERRIVALLVWRVEVRQKAKRDFGIEISSAEINRNVDQIRQQWGANERQFRRMLKRLGLTLDLLRADLRARLTYRAVIERLRSVCVVTEDEISAYYEAHRDAYTAPENRDVRDILVPTRATAVQLRSRADAGASFAVLARRYSHDRMSRRRGGLVTVFRGSSALAFERAVFALRREQISRPIRTRRGWHVIKAVSRIRPRRTAPLLEVRATILDTLLRKQLERRTWLWSEELRAEYVDKVLYQVGFAPGD